MYHKKKLVLSATFLACAELMEIGTGSAWAQPSGYIVGWGEQVVVAPAALEGLIALAAGGRHGLGLRSDGTIIAWGSNRAGECRAPEPNSAFVAVAAGNVHNLALKSGGMIAACTMILETDS